MQAMVTTGTAGVQEVGWIPEGFSHRPHPERLVMMENPFGPLVARRNRKASLRRLADRLRRRAATRLSSLRDRASATSLVLVRAGADAAAVTESPCVMDGSGGVGVDELCWGQADPADLTDVSGGDMVIEHLLQMCAE